MPGQPPGEFPFAEPAFHLFVCDEILPEEIVDFVTERTEFLTKVVNNCGGSAFAAARRAGCHQNSHERCIVLASWAVRDSRLLRRFARMG